MRDDSRTMVEQKTPESHQSDGLMRGADSRCKGTVRQTPCWRGVSGQARPDAALFMTPSCGLPW
jgi:hypothetical protein